MLPTGECFSQIKTQRRCVVMAQKVGGARNPSRRVRRLRARRAREARGASVSFDGLRVVFRNVEDGVGARISTGRSSAAHR
jgi:hypothetical protein